jgi:alpha-L-fucosidase
MNFCEKDAAAQCLSALGHATASLGVARSFWSSKRDRPLCGQPAGGEIKIVTEIGDWLRVNGDAICATGPWKIFGEGPSLAINDRHWSGGQSDVQSKPYTAEDIRFTQSKNGKTLYAIVLAVPGDGKITVKSLASNSQNWPGKIGSVRMLGVSGKLKFTRDENRLQVTLPQQLPSQVALALKIQP